MEIRVSEKIQRMLDERQRIKKEAIRKNPIYDQEIYLPIRGTMIRCLEYIPKNQSEKLPVVFDMHGGGFTNGYPEEDDYFCRQVCDQLKVRVFSIDYRLAPKNPYPQGQLDVYEAITYIHDHDTDYRILPDQMVVCGHSAGGNYALTAAIRAVMDGRFSFRGMILDYPPLDMSTPEEEKIYVEGGIPRELVAVFDSCYCLPQQRDKFLCSPVLAPDSILQKLPPATMISCELDSLREEEEAFALRLIKNGVEVCMRRFLKERHAFAIDYENPAASEAHEFMIQGIRRYLNLTRE